MNVEQLRSVIDAVVADTRKQRLTGLVQRLTETYSQTFQSPTAESAQAFDAAYQDLLNSVMSGQCARLPPSGIAVLTRLNAADLCGPGLRQAIDAVIRSSDTPATKVTGLQDLRQRLEQLTQMAANMRDAMAAMKIEAGPIPQDTAEVEISIPNNLIDGSLGGLARETKRLNSSLLDIAECASGSRPELKIRSLSTGSVEIFIIVDPLSGAGILVLVTAITNLITAIIGLRKSRASYTEYGAPPDLLRDLKALEERKRDETLQKLADDLLVRLEETNGKQRRNELEQSVRRSVEYMADRVDRGMEVTVSVLPSAPEQPPPDSAAGPVEAATWQIAQAMQGRQRIERQPEPVLALPPLRDDANSEERKDSSDSDVAKRKKAK